MTVPERDETASWYNDEIEVGVYVLPLVGLMFTVTSSAHAQAGPYLQANQTKII